MNRLIVLVVGCAVALLLAAASALADNGPHVAGAGPVADSCAGCHRAHTAQAPKLIKQDSQEALCYTCHGTSGTGANTDVQDGVGYTGANRSGPGRGPLRGGGFEYALIDSGNPDLEEGGIGVLASGQPVNSAHSSDSSNQTAWGNGAISADPNYGKTLQLTCGSCHDPHGNGNYRVLRPIPNGSGATSPGVVIGDTSIKSYITYDYGRSSDPNTQTFGQGIAQWCSTCHTRYIRPSGSGHTDSGDSVYAYGHRSATPNCATCHVAHGSNARMSGEAAKVNRPDGTPGGTDSRLLRIDNYGVCQMCHNK